MTPSDFTIDTVSVKAFSTYQSEYSVPVDNNYVFAYRVRITNRGQHSVRLLRRHWIVTDAAGQIKEVEGEGVVGQKPVLAPGQSHEYTSWVQLETPMGSMEGSFLMEQPANSPNDQSTFFRAEIPKFFHVSPELLN